METQNDIQKVENKSNATVPLHSIYYDDDCKVILSEPYQFGRLYRIGQSITIQSKGYSIIQAVIHHGVYYLFLSSKLTGELANILQEATKPNR